MQPVRENSCEHCQDNVQTLKACGTLCIRLSACDRQLGGRHRPNFKMRGKYPACMSLFLQNRLSATNLWRHGWRNERGRSLIALRSVKLVSSARQVVVGSARAVDVLHRLHRRAILPTTSMSAPKREGSPQSPSKKPRVGEWQLLDATRSRVIAYASSVTGTVYSQPVDTGIGRHWKTQLLTAINFLKVSSSGGCRWGGNAGWGIARDQG